MNRLKNIINKNRKMLKKRRVLILWVVELNQQSHKELSLKRKLQL